VNFGLEEFVVWSCAAVLLLIILIEWFISPIARNVESFFPWLNLFANSKAFVPVLRHARYDLNIVLKYADSLR